MKLSEDIRDCATVMPKGDDVLLRMWASRVEKMERLIMLLTGKQVEVSGGARDPVLYSEVCAIIFGNEVGDEQR